MYRATYISAAITLTLHMHMQSRMGLMIARTLGGHAMCVRLYNERSLTVRK